MTKFGVILAPVVSEKSFRLATSGQYTFVVDRRATSSQVAHALTALFSVHPVSVRTLNMSGKLTRHKGVHGQRSSWRKAIVTLTTGERIPGFEVEAAKEAPKAKASSAPKNSEARAAKGGASVEESSTSKGGITTKVRKSSKSIDAKESQ